MKYIDKKMFDYKNEAMERGVEIHSLLEDYYKPVEKMTLTADKTPAETAKILNDEIVSHQLFEKHKEPVANFINFNARWKNEIPIYTEEKLEDAYYNIVGVIDRVSMRDNKLILWDYKSGKPHPINNYRFELALYAYLFEVNHNQKIDYWGIYFIDVDTEIIEKVSREEMQKAINKVIEIRKEINECLNRNSFVKKPCFECRWCDVKRTGLCNEEIYDSNQRQ